MKRYILYYKLITVFLATAFLPAGCNTFDEWLEVEPTTELESAYFTEENHIERGIGAIYAELIILWQANAGNQATFDGSWTKQGMWMLPSDEMTTNNGNNATFECFLNINPDNGTIASEWGMMYATINRANFMLEKLADPKVQAVIKTEGYGDWCRGECLFLRSYCNLRLWNDFRKAPNQTVRITEIAESLLPPTHGFELLDQVIEDLKEVEQLLPDSWNEKNRGRAFKNSARGLLVKACMLRACYASLYGGDKNNDYRNAIQAFERIDPNITTIEGVPFGDNFDYRKENNKESLFENQASLNPGKEDNPWLNGNFGGNAGSMGVIYMYMYNDYLQSYFYGSFYGPSQKVMEMYDPDDPRYKETFFDSNTQTVPADYPWMGSTGSSFGGIQFIKYINGARRGDLDHQFGVNSANNPRVLRLADIKLMAAEAYLQTGDEAKARQQVNDVRRRARKSTSGGVESAVPADYTSPVTMQNIMDERLLELFGEEDSRWTDLRRWHAAGYIDLGVWAQDPVKNWGYNPAIYETEFSFDVNKHLLYPIPWEEMQRNPKMQQDGQNPGYN